MKKTVIVLMLVLCGASVLCAQSVLSGYRGYWERSRQINIIDLIEFYPDHLPFLRNEIYARYGRPFVNQTYRDYFRAKSWYQEKSNFSESWLTQNDKVNAEFISSIERSVKNDEEVTAQVLRNIEYTGGRAVMTFTSRNELRWSDSQVDFGPYGLSGDYMQSLNWFVMGDWVLVFGYFGYRGSYDVVAYKLDHAARRITDSVSRSDVDWEMLGRLLKAQGRAPD